MVGYLSTTQPPCDTETAVSSGLLGSPLLGTATRVAADWCHALEFAGTMVWMGHLSGPETGVWPRHGHLRGILDGFQGRQPTFTSGRVLHMSKDPANTQPPPRRGHDKSATRRQIYQAMEIERGFMRPTILHGFGTSAKQRLPSRLAELAQFGWLPLAAALFGTVDWQPQWLTQFSPCHRLTSSCEDPTFPALLSANRGIAWPVGAKSYYGKPVPCPHPRSGPYLWSPSSVSDTRALANRIKGESFI